MNPLQKLQAAQLRMENVVFKSPWPWDGKTRRRVKKRCREFNSRVQPGAGSCSGRLQQQQQQKRKRSKRRRRRADMSARSCGLSHSNEYETFLYL